MLSRFVPRIIARAITTPRTFQPFSSSATLFSHKHAESRFVQVHFNQVVKAESTMFEEFKHFGKIVGDESLASELESNVELQRFFKHIYTYYGESEIEAMFSRLESFKHTNDWGDKTFLKSMKYLSEIDYNNVNLSELVFGVYTHSFNVDLNQFKDLIQKIIKEHPSVTSNIPKVEVKR